METILTVKEESMIAVADAVREKSGTSGALSFPNGMVDAINSIETSIAAVEVDNKTIIQDENGVISTAIGGYRTEAVPAELLYETNENVNASFDTYSSEQIFEMSGYFTLPNWTTIGASDRTMRATWEEHPYLDAPDWITTAFADVFWVDDTYRTMMVENIQGSELIHSAAIDNETGVFGGLAPHIYEDPNSWSHIFISNFKIEVPESEAGFSPIDARFINIDTGTLSNESGVLNAYPVLDQVNPRLEDYDMRIGDLQNQVDEMRNNGSGSSNASDITFDDTAAQIGVDNIQAAIEYLADEAASSTSVQLQIDENDISLAKDLQRYEATRVYWYRGAVNASDFDWSNKICPQLTYHQGVIYWDLEETNLLGVYANNYLVFSKQSGLEYIMKKGHYYQFRELQWDYFKAFCDKYGREGNTEYYFGVQNDLPVLFSPVSQNIFAIYYDNMKCYVFTDVTYVYADAASGVSEDRVNELINEALGVIENGTY